jgi:2-polyprenyl-3-methyl-5-hydroxy-6-metoxy-1,4-benzoquinol methylase
MTEVMNEKTHLQPIQALNDFFDLEDREVAGKAQFYEGTLLATFDEFISRKHRFGDLVRWARLHGQKAEKGEIIDLTAQKPGLRILDAGCGVGSESLMFAFLGAQVTGVDLMEERLALAQHRVRFYQSEAGRPIQVEFIRGDLFSIMESRPFDAIWIREAISHIHPLEKFIDCAHQTLTNGGRMFVSDTNWANPLVKWETFQNYKNRLKWYHLMARRREAGLFYVQDDYYDPISGKDVPMAQERLFAPQAFRELLESRGFRVVEQRTIGFLPKAALVKFLPQSMRLQGYSLLDSLESSFRYVPLLKSLGATTITVSEKVESNGGNGSEQQ